MCGVLGKSGKLPVRILDRHILLGVFHRFDRF